MGFHRTGMFSLLDFDKQQPIKFFLSRLVSSPETLIRMDGMGIPTVLKEVMKLISVSMIKET